MRAFIVVQSTAAVTGYHPPANAGFLCHKADELGAAIKESLHLGYLRCWLKIQIIWDFKMFFY